MATEPAASGDSIPQSCVLIEVRIGELKQLFNAIDPSPFRERDLDPEAEAFIVGWARETHRDGPFALLVHLDRPAGPPDEAAALREAIHEFFTHRVRVTTQRLRQLLRIGRTSLLIGLAFLAASIAISQAIAGLLTGGEASMLREVMLIGGWVAMWRPLEIFLYDWWPIRAEARLYRRLADMPVRIAYSSKSDDSDRWRKDWPAVPAHGKTA